MRAVVQRVAECSVSVEARLIDSIADGLLVYLGVSDEDDADDARYLAEKVANLRIFLDVEGKMNLSAADLEKEVLVVSQFTLYADARKGRRPSYSHAAEPELASRLYVQFIDELKLLGFSPKAGEFGAMMDVRYVNKGPVTILLDSQKLF